MRIFFFEKSIVILPSNSNDFSDHMTKEVRQIEPKIAQYIKKMIRRDSKRREEKRREEKRREEKRREEKRREEKRREKKLENRAYSCSQAAVSTCKLCVSGSENCDRFARR